MELQQEYDIGIVRYALRVERYGVYNKHWCIAIYAFNRKLNLWWQYIILNMQQRLTMPAKLLRH